MDYKATKCPTCGAENLTVLETVEIDGDKYHRYHCPYCGNIFTSKKANASLVKDSGSHKNDVYEFAPTKYTAKDIYKKAVKSIVNIYCAYGDKLSAGTGIFINKHFILTNAHVINNPDPDNCAPFTFGKISCAYQDSSDAFRAELVYSDNAIDLAILKTEATNESFNKLNLVEPVTGEKVFAVGNAKNLGLSIVDGLVSNANANGKIMFSAPINHGNSGGPLYNEKGQIIGVVTSILTNANSIDYAINMKSILGFIHEAENKEEINII